MCIVCAQTSTHLNEGIAKIETLNEDEMSREVRMVPFGWEHPKDDNGRYVPLKSGYKNCLEDFSKHIEAHGLEDAIEYFGGGPRKGDYMLVDIPESKCVMLMMYENTSEGTPISPAFATPEELARWLTDNKASAFGSMTATYEQWLAICKNGWAPSAIYDPENGLRSGVAGIVQI